MRPCASPRRARGEPVLGPGAHAVEGVDGVVEEPCRTADHDEAVFAPGLTVVLGAGPPGEGAVDKARHVAVVAVGGVEEEGQVLQVQELDVAAGGAIVRRPDRVVGRSGEGVVGLGDEVEMLQPSASVSKLDAMVVSGTERVSVSLSVSPSSGVEAQAASRRSRESL